MAFQTEGHKPHKGRLAPTPSQTKKTVCAWLREKDWSEIYASLYLPSDWKRQSTVLRAYKTTGSSFWLDAVLFPHIFQASKFLALLVLTARFTICQHVPSLSLIMATALKPPPRRSQSEYSRRPMPPYRECLRVVYRKITRVALPLRRNKWAAGRAKAELRCALA